MFYNIYIYTYIHSYIHIYIYIYIYNIYTWDNSKAIANGLVGQVFVGPLFLKVKTKFHFAKKQIINKSTSVIFGLLQLVTFMIQMTEKHIMRWKIIGRP